MSGTISEHPKYNWTTSDNDFMLVRLTRSATTIPVPMVQSDVTNYSTFSAIGFGNMDPTECRDFPLRLEDVEVSFVSCARCFAGVVKVTM